MTEISPEVIRADLEKLKDKLKVLRLRSTSPRLKISATRLAISGSSAFSWKRGQSLHFSDPVQPRFRPVGELPRGGLGQEALDRRCGGCHATGVNLEKRQFQRARGWL